MHAKSVRKCVWAHTCVCVVCQSCSAVALENEVSAGRVCGAVASVQEEGGAVWRGGRRQSPLCVCEYMCVCVRLAAQRASLSKKCVCFEPGTGEGEAGEIAWHKRGVCVHACEREREVCGCVTDELPKVLLVGVVVGVFFFARGV